MKNKVRTPWVEFFRTGKFYKNIEIPEKKDEDDHLFDELKKKKDEKKKEKLKPKVYHWELSVTLIDGHVTSLTTVNPDDDDFSGEDAFDNLLEWFQCSNNPSYLFRFKDGIKIFIRDKITEIQVMRKEMKQ